MPKHYKEMMDEIINKIDEDAPANAVGDGSNVALPPKHEPGVKKDKRKEIDPLMFAKPIKRKIKESDDNNNVVVRGVFDKIENILSKRIKIKDDSTVWNTDLVEALASECVAS